VEQTYRIVSKVETPLIFHAELFPPQAVYGLLGADGQFLRTSLPRRDSWAVGDEVRIEEALVLLNLVE